MPAGSNRMLMNFDTYVSSGTPYCKRDGDRDRERVHHPGQRRALLAHLEEDLAEAVVGVARRRHVALGTADRERRRHRRTRLRQPLAHRAVLHDRLRLVLAGALVLALAGRQRLPDLAVVAVDRERLEAVLPALEVDLLDLVDGRRLRHVHGLGDRAGQERLDRRHHLHVAHGLDRPHAHRAVEHVVVLGPQARCVDDIAVLGDVLDDRLDLLVLVAELAQRPRHGLVDDLHRPAADELLELHQREVRLDAGGVAVHHQADRAGGCEHRRLRVAPAVLGADRRCRRPRLGLRARGRCGWCRRVHGPRRWPLRACA